MILRHLANPLRRLANQYPVVTLTGPRQSGKTTLCRAVFSNLGYANLEDLDTRRLATEDPRAFLARFPKGVVLDEIQRTPDLPSYIQGMVDEKDKPGMFILTGSQQFGVFNTIRQSLAGRTAIVRLMPFAYSELYSKGKTPDVNEILYKGFYPRIHDKSLNPTEALSFYLATYVERDLRDLIHVRDLSSFEKFLKICASQIGQLINYSKLGNDCGIDQKTVKSWLSILEASYVVFHIYPHFRNFRKRLTQHPKLYFYDVGLATYLLGITHKDHVETHPLKGSLFENFVVAEILKHRFNNVEENNLYFFRDHVGNEVDLLLDYGNEIVSVEIKMGKTLNSDFFKGLQYYAQINKTENKGRYIVYGGAEHHVSHDMEAFPYSQLDRLLCQWPHKQEKAGG